ncbi:MAG TPA: hypothetical protein VG942_05690 [Hyphomonadaceae bacterium]|nr:hypothetical protein [Steroidobacteraceae bacterium]HVY88340.1 hypothetical protein [Hyphomonadaceae bacterium]
MTVSKTVRVQSEYLQMLVSVFDFMRKSGLAESEIKKLCDEAISHRKKRNVLAGTECATTLAVAALTLEAWHRNRRYMRGIEPRAIPLTGPSPSVEALVRAQGISADARAVAGQLKSLGLITRTTAHLYRPSNRMALVSGRDPVIQEYVARSSSTLLATIKHNTSRAGSSSPLIERFAEVPDLPRAKIREFRRFARLQGWAFLRTLNDWLEAKRLRDSTARADRTVRAGVHLYAYVDPLAPKATALAKRRNASRALG